MRPCRWSIGRARAAGAPWTCGGWACCWDLPESMYGVAEGWRLATAFLSHWSALHAIANAIAAGPLGVLVARQEDLGVLARIALVGFAAPVLVLDCLSAATQYRCAAAVAYPIRACMLLRSITPNPF